MNGVPMVAYLGIALWMFCVGVTGVMVRRNPIVIFMCVELMLNAVNLTFVTFARYLPVHTQGSASAIERSVSGEAMVVFVMAVAAAEVAVGLGIIMSIFRLRHKIDVDDLNLLRG